jgi:hypothetical protein
MVPSFTFLSVAMNAGATRVPLAEDAIMMLAGLDWHAPRTERHRALSREMGKLGDYEQAAAE